MKKYLITFTALIMVSAVGFITFRRLNSEKPKTEAPAVLSQSQTVVEETPQSFTVEGGSFFFKPNEIKVKSGQKVVITFNNSGGFHDFVIDELNVKTKQLKSEETEVIEFTPEKPGTYEFYCSVGNHRAMGMKGTLIVE